MMIGSKVNIWKQDPSVESIEIRTSYIHGKIDEGPKDRRIRIAGLPTVLPNEKNNYLFHPEDNSQAFDAVHTFAVVRQTLTMYQRAMVRLGLKPIKSWQWGRAALRVYPRAGIRKNATYSRTNRSLNFFYFPSALREGRTVFTCRSFDIVAHEAGHAILDSIKPGFLESTEPQTGALHESFGDLTAIFTMLSQLDVCEAIVAESKLDLRDKAFISAIGEQFGEEVYGRGTGLRNANNDKKMSDVTNQVHDLSTVLTGAVFDILADLFADQLDLEKTDPAYTLFEIGQALLSIFSMAIHQSPTHNVTYADIAKLMIENTRSPDWKDVMTRRFEQREILGVGMNFAKIAADELDWSKCSFTLRSDEVQNMRLAALKRANG